MEVVGYQRVQHALPDGRPDLDAPDNYWVKTTTQWFLVSDSDDVVPDERGVRHVHVPPFCSKGYVRYDSQGRASKKLLASFKEVTFDGVPLRKPVPDGSGSRSGALDVEMPKCQRVLYWQVRSVVDEVEAHSEGKRRLTRSMRKAFWSVSTQGWTVGKPYIPDRRPMVAREPDPHVQVDPPTFGFGPVVLPRDDAL